MCFRMNRISDVYFVGGFGTVQWLDVAEYMAATPDSIVMHQPLRVLQVDNSMQIVPHHHGVGFGMASRVTGKTAHAGMRHAALSCGAILECPHDVAVNMQVLNDTYAVELRHLIRQGEREASDAQFISIDRLGADVRARFGTDYSVERVGFDKVS